MEKYINKKKIIIELGSGNGCIKKILKKKIKFLKIKIKKNKKKWNKMQKKKLKINIAGMIMV